LSHNPITKENDRREVLSISSVTLQESVIPTPEKLRTYRF